MNLGNRVCVVGGTGTGKTTLGDNLSKVLDIPVLHIDGINYFPNWVPRDMDERNQMILDYIKNDKWVIDGTYMQTIENRFERADTIIFLNFSALARLKGIIVRHLKGHGKEKKEIPGCVEGINFHLVMQALRYGKKAKRIREILKKYGDEKNVLVFKRRKDLNKWFEKEFNKEIEL